MMNNDCSLTDAPVSDLTLRDYARVLFRQKYVIAVSIITVLAVVTVGVLFKTPVYTATVTMLLSAEKQVETPHYRDLPTRAVEATLTQTEMVTARPVLERVVQSLRLYQQPPDYEAGFASAIKQRFIAWRTEQQRRRLTVLSDEQVETMRYLQAIESLKQRVSVEPVRDTNLFYIKVSDYNPVVASILANVVSRSYVLYDLEQQMSELQMKYGEKHLRVVALNDSIAQMRQTLDGRSLENLEAMGPAGIKIVEQAAVPLQPQGPSKAVTLLLAAVMSVFLGVMLAFMFEYLDQTFKSVRDVETTCNLPLLGSIPRRSLGQPILLRSGKGGAYAHAYQLLAEQLSVMMRDKKIKTVLLTAARRQEGVSSVAINLARMFSEAGKRRVLLIDANLRASSLARLLKLPPQAPGLSQVLTQTVTVEAALQQVSPRLSVMSAGATELNPLPLLESAGMQMVLEKARQQFDIVVIDAADLIDCRDGVVVATNVEATILVVTESQTRRIVAQRALDLLRAKQVPLAGVILNNRVYAIPKFIYDRI